MDNKALSMRKNKLAGTDDVAVLKHVNMDSDHDNLYLVMIQLTPLEDFTVQLVQADPYETWCEDKGVVNQVDFSKGEWHCTVMLPYYKNVNDPLDKVSWRYQVHPIKTASDGTIEFDAAYYSFDDPSKRGGFDSLMDWSEPISLLPYPKGSFIYGPFDFSDSSSTPNKISREDWLAVLPTLLELKTTKGPMFYHGFSDSILTQVAKLNAKSKKCFLKKSMIEDAKQTTPGDPMADYVPVDHSLISYERRSSIKRCIPQTPKDIKSKHPCLFEPVLAPDSPRKGRKGSEKHLKKIGALMTVETPTQKFQLHARIEKRK